MAVVAAASRQLSAVQSIRDSVVVVAAAMLQISSVGGQFRKKGEEVKANLRKLDDMVSLGHHEDFSWPLCVHWLLSIS